MKSIFRDALNLECDFLLIYEHLVLQIWSKLVDTVPSHDLLRFVYVVAGVVNGIHSGQSIVYMVVSFVCLVSTFVAVLVTDLQL